MHRIKGTGVILSSLLFLFSQGCAPAKIPQPSATAIIANISTDLPTSTATNPPEPTNTLLPTQTPLPATITFELDGGGTYEMLQFGTAQEAVTFIAQHARWHKGQSESEGMPAHTEWLKVTPDSTAFFERVYRIPGWQPKLGLVLPPTGQQFFLLNIDELGDGTALLFESLEAQFVLVYVAMEQKAFAKALGNYNMDILWECMGTATTVESCQESPIVLFTPTTQP